MAYYRNVWFDVNTCLWGSCVLYVYLGGLVHEASQQQGDNMDSSSPYLCLLLCLYQGSQTGAQL